MDYKGQELVEYLYQLIGILCAIVGFVVGFVLQDLSIAVKCVGFGLVLSMLLCVPDWPFYNRNPIEWQPAVVFEDEQEDEKEGQGKDTDATATAEDATDAKATADGAGADAGSSSGGSASTKGKKQKPQSKKAK